MKIAFVMLNVLSTERMSVMLLSALAKQHLSDVQVELFVWADGMLKHQIRRFEPDVVAYSAMTGEHTQYLKIAMLIKRWQGRFGKKIFQIMGGPHCTFAPEILKGSALDAVAVGECDESWPAFLWALGVGANISHYSGIVTQENFNKAVKPAALSESYIKYKYEAINMGPRTCEDKHHQKCLDHLPFLDWELFLAKTDFEEKNSLLKRTIMTRRGCPFKCTYCFNRVFNALHAGQQPVHSYSVDRVIEECKWVGKKWPTEFWKFYDDIFAFSSKGEEGERLEEFAEKWPREIGLPFFVLLRADLVANDPEILRLLKKAGCASVTMSIEGGNEFVRSHILERKMTDEQIIVAHHQAWDLGIKTFSNIILSVPVWRGDILKYNLPERSLDRDIQSVELCLKSRVHFVEAPMLFPYPATKLGKYCSEMRFFDGDIDKLPQSYQNVSPFDCFSPQEKRMSQNLALLSMPVVFLGSRQSTFVREFLSPLFFKLVTKFLIRLPWRWCTKIYFLMYAVLQQWLCGAEIYRPKYRTPWQTFRQGFWKRLMYEYKKQFPKK